MGKQQQQPRQHKVVAAMQKVVVETVGQKQSTSCRKAPMHPTTTALLHTASAHLVYTPCGACQNSPPTSAPRACSIHQRIGDRQSAPNTTLRRQALWRGASSCICV